jgi:hypothetical protein
LINIPEQTTAVISPEITDIKKVLVMLTESISRMERSNRKLVSDVQEILRRQLASAEMIKEINNKLTALNAGIHMTPPQPDQEISGPSRVPPHHAMSQQEQESRMRTRTYYQAQLAHLNLKYLTCQLLKDTPQFRVTAFEAKHPGIEVTDTLRKALIPAQTMYTNDYRQADTEIGAYIKSNNGKLKQQPGARMPPTIGGIPSIVVGYGTSIPPTTPLRSAYGQEQELPDFSFFSYTGKQKK